MPEAAYTAEGYSSLRTMLNSGNAAGHEYDVSGVFATNPKDAPGPGESPLLKKLQLQAVAPCMLAWLNVLHLQCCLERVSWWDTPRCLLSVCSRLSKRWVSSTRGMRTICFNATAITSQMIFASSLQGSQHLCG